MTSIVIQNFGGIAPRINPKALSNEMAQVADNCRLDRNVLEPLRGLEDLEAATATAKSLYKYQGAWLTSTEETDYVGSMLANDVLERLYYTDETYPKVRSGAAVYRLGLPAPGTPSVAVTNPPAVDDLDATTRSYVVTVVDAWGAEGPPSLPSANFDVIDGEEVVVTLPAAPTGAYNLSSGAKFRIYRANTGETGSYYQYVDEVLINVTTYSDTIKSAFLQEVLPSTDWVGPPDDNLSLYPDGPLQGLTELPNGILAGFSGNTLCFSEPYLPHAWPTGYRMSSTSKIVGLVQTQQGLVVCTDNKPFLVTGTHPESMTRVEIESYQPCMSKYSIVDMGDFAMYASPDGLVVVQGNSAQLVTLDFVTRDFWKAVQPETMRAFYYEGMYVANFGSIDNRKGFIFDPRGGKNSIVVIDDLGVVDSWRNTQTDEYFLLYKQSPSVWRIGRFDTGAEKTYRWLSKKFTTPKPVTFSTIRVEADRYPITLRVLADGRERAVYTLENGLPLRMPGGFRARTWEIEVTGQGILNYVAMAESMAEVI